MISAKVKIRSFALWLYDVTTQWVVPNKISSEIDQLLSTGRPEEARAILGELERAWPREDKELVRLNVYISFCAEDL